MHVVSPVPYCPPVPKIEALRGYRRFRAIERSELRRGVEIIRPRFFSGPGTSLYGREAAAIYLGARPMLDRLAEREPFDLIHGHFIYPEGAVAHRLSKRYGVPFVITEHAPWVERWFARRSVRREAIAAARAASALLPVSTSVRDSIAAYTGDGVNRMHVIPIGVDETLFPLGPREGRDRDLILYVGLINFNKGIDVLLGAMARLAATGRRGRLMLVGGAFFRNTQSQGDRLRALATSLGLEDRVEFVGMRSPAEVAELMRSCALVVLPSRAESFGSTLIEALASGTPVVATRCGGPEDIVVDSVGRLVPPGDADALADALTATLLEPDAYPPEALRDYAVSRFSLRTVAESTRREYLRAMGTEVPDAETRDVGPPAEVRT
jgi:glycosyltransferase involved in cell wall biosynthesis